MLVYNKYLKELGYKKSDFPFTKKDDRYKLDKETGVVEAQTWALHNTIVLELYTYLRAFQENCPKGIPGPFIDESKSDHGRKDWENTVQKIIDGLKAYTIAENLEPSSDYEADKAEQTRLYNQFDEAWTLLGEYIQCFWW